MQPARKEVFMTRIVKSSVAAFAVAAMGMVSISPASAQHYYYDDNYGRGYDRGYERSSDDGYYRGRGYDDRRYRNARGERCGKGTGGLIIGAVAGGLLGRAVVGRRGDRTAGTIIGAGAGALAGRALERSGNRC
jgi:hypothetical protein